MTITTPASGLRARRVTWSRQCYRSGAWVRSIQDRPTSSTARWKLANSTGLWMKLFTPRR
jgi:hypothetical protein